MIILKINRLIERHGKLAMLIIAAAVVIPFVFMWGPHSVFDGFSSGRAVRELGTMFGEPIRIEQLARQLRFAQLEKLEREGQLVEFSRGPEGQRLLEQALEQMRFLRAARERGLDQVAEAQIDEWVAMTFRGEDGRFDRDYYSFFRQYILPQLGLNEQDYRDFVKNKIVVGRLWREAMSGIFVAPAEIDYQIRRNQEQFRAAYRILDRHDFSDQVDLAMVDDTAVRRYFDANRGSELPSGLVITELDEDTKRAIREYLIQDVAEQFYRENVGFLQKYVEETGDLNQALNLYQERYSASVEASQRFPLTPEQAEEKVDRYIRQIYQPTRKRFIMAVFEAADFMDQVEVSETELQQAYEGSAELYEKQIEARHILIRIEEDEDTEARAEAEREAREKLRELQEKLAAGADFAELAAEHSDDPGSAAQGGSLGRFRHGQMVAPFADAAFALEEGEISQIVETRFGYHLIKVDEIIPKRTIEEVGPELRQQVRLRKARNAAWATADNFSYLVYEQSGDAGLTGQAETMRRLADEQNIELVDSGFFNLRQLPALFQGNRRAAEKVYELSARQSLSDAIEANNRFITALFIDSLPAAIPQFAASPEARELALAWSRREKSIALAQRRASELQQKISTDYGPEIEPEKLMETYDFIESDLFTRTSLPELTGEYRSRMIEQLDKQPPGKLSEPIKTSSGAMLVYLIEQIEPDPEALEENRESARQQVYSRKAQLKMQWFMEYLENRAQTELVEDPLAYLGR